MIASPHTERFLAPTHYIDSTSPEIAQFVSRALHAVSADADETQKAVRLFEAVRDGLRYDPYAFMPRADDYRASAIARMSAGFCVPKAILLAAALRHAGIPAALGFSDVKNHLNSPKLAEMMGTDLFIYHGYVKLWLGAQSFKVTPAFNSELCARFGVKPLVFDGTADALFHEYDMHQNRHMEYVRDRGLFEDFPAAEFLAAFHAHYPRLVELSVRRAEDMATTSDDQFT